MNVADVISRVLDRTSFPRITSTEKEATKVAWLRIATALVLLWRNAMIMRDSWSYFDPVDWMGVSWPVEGIAASGQVALSIGLLLGLRPAACALGLMTTTAAFSIQTGTYNLAPMLLISMLGAFAALETGRLCLWANPSPPPPASVYRSSYFLLFSVYGALSFQACLYHLRDENWLGGVTPGLLLTNSYLSEFYGVFRSIEAAIPSLYHTGSAVVVVMQSLFQLAMIPLLFSRAGTGFVVLWGWIFIFISLFFIQISILPVVEVILWWLIFVPPLFAARTNGMVPAGQTSNRAQPRWRQTWQWAFLGLFGVLTVAHLGNALSTFLGGPTLPRFVTSYLHFYTGLVAPNVFNREDLTMGDHWVVIDRVDPPYETRVPLNGQDGERLAYHRSDLLYYANSLPWRRAMIDQPDLAAFHAEGAVGFNYAYKIARYHFLTSGQVGTGIYRAVVYANRASDVTARTDRDRYVPQEITRFNIEIAPAQRSP